MPTNYDDEEEKRRLREQTATMRQPAPDFTGARGLGAAETARQGAMQRIGGYVANPNDTVAERSFGSDWARSMRARGRLSAPSLAEQSLGQARAAQRINAFRAQRGGGEDAAWRADAYGEVADRLQQQVDRDKQLEREEMEKWLESQGKNLALSYAERKQRQEELGRLRAEDAALRQDDLSRFGIESQLEANKFENAAKIRVAELGFEGTQATAAGGVAQAQIRGDADRDVAGIRSAGDLAVEQRKGENAVRTAYAEADAAPWASRPDGGIFNRTNGDVVDKPDKPAPGVVIKPGESYLDPNSDKVTVAPGTDEASTNNEILAITAALGKAFDPTAVSALQAQLAEARKRLAKLRGEPYEAGAAAPPRSSAPGAARANDFGR